VVEDATVNDVRSVDEIPRLGDAVEVDGQTMRVRSVARAEPGAGVDAFVYVTPAGDG
jgi:hypothetical protein